MPTYSKQELVQVLRPQIRRRSTEMSSEQQQLAHGLLDMLPATVQFSSHPVFVPALLVLPFGMVPFMRQLESIRYAPMGSDEGLQPAYSFLNPKNIVDLEVKGVSLPSDKPYVILHVDDGETMKGDAPASACRALASLIEPRHPVTVSQGLALAGEEPQLFDRHNMYLSGSRIKDERSGELFTPDLWVYGGQIKMKRDSSTAFDSRWATPSWKGIITL